MKKNILVVVDMQNDFIFKNYALGSDEAEKVFEDMISYLQNIDTETYVIFTRDTHGDDYLHTQEGKKLPVIHCVKGSDGWQICDKLKPYVEQVVDKVTFGSVDLPHILSKESEQIEEIELCGLCTDICVISNAMILKAAFPEVKITVDASCCAGVTMESHITALNAMKAVQIDVME